MADYKNPFYINQRLELAPVEGLSFMSSRIEDFSGEDFIVAMPMRNSIPVFLPKGTKIAGKALTNEGILYAFESELLDYTMQPIPLWTIKKPENIQQVQQRNFFRYDISLPVRFFQIGSDNNLLPDTEILLYSKNLSAGGVLVLSPRMLARIGAKAWLEISLDDSDPLDMIKTLATIRRIDIKNISEKKMFMIAFQFVDMEEPTVRRIVKFLNKRIIDIYNKGIL